jgi:hypothetical protein
MSMPGVETSESELHERLTAILRAMPPLTQVLSVAPAYGYPAYGPPAYEYPGYAQPGYGYQGYSGNPAYSAPPGYGYPGYSGQPAYPSAGYGSQNNSGTLPTPDPRPLRRHPHPVAQQAAVGGVVNVGLDHCGVDAHWFRRTIRRSRIFGRSRPNFTRARSGRSDARLGHGPPGSG